MHIWNELVKKESQVQNWQLKFKMVFGYLKLKRKAKRILVEAKFESYYLF